MWFLTLSNLILPQDKPHFYEFDASEARFWPILRFGELWFGLIVKYKSLKEVLELFGAVNVRESLVVKELFDFKQEEHVVVSFSSEYPIVHR